jgi:copper transport protein
VIPPSIAGSGGPPFWLASLARWFAFLTLSLLAGLWLTWLIVIRPALRPVWQVGPQVVTRVKRYAMIAGLLYLLSSVLALIVQVSGQSDGSWFRALSDTLLDTRWGRMWILRLVYGGMTTIVFTIAAWWWPRRRAITTSGLLILSALLPMPHALVSHASAQASGRREALIADYVHLLAMSLWVGGLALVALAITALGDLEPAGRKAYLASAIPRFSALALTCWAALGATGIYAGYLHVGAWKGLFDTRYGHALFYKLLILGAVLCVAGFNLLVVSRGVRNSSVERASGWWRRFSVSIALELVGIILVLVFVGRLTGSEPARSVLAERENQHEISFNLGDRTARLSLAPGTAGPNHFRLDVDGGPIPASATASILLVPPVDVGGNKSVDLERTTGNTFETHSTEMSVVGDWAMTVTVSETGSFQWTTNITYPATERATGALSIQRPAWTFNGTGLAGFALAIAGVVALMVGWRAAGRSLRREGFGLGTVAIACGVLLMLGGRTDAVSAGIALDTPNPVPLTDETISVGQQAYATNCIACHGVGAAGDGPAAGSMIPPPANLLEGHALYHADAEFFNWIRNGKPGTAMPAFSSSLSDEQIWSTIRYIRQLQEEHAAGLGTPVATPMVMP